MSGLVPVFISSRVYELPGLAAAPFKMAADGGSLLLGIAASALAVCKFGTDEELNSFADRTTRIHGGNLLSRPYIALLSIVSPDEGKKLQKEAAQVDEGVKKARFQKKKETPLIEIPINLACCYHSFLSRNTSSQLFFLSAIFAYHQYSNRKREENLPLHKKIREWVVREIASRLTYAVATIVAIVARSLDLLSGLVLALVSLGSGGYSSSLNQHAYVQLKAGAGIGDICMGLRAVFGDVRQFIEEDFLDTNPESGNDTLYSMFLALDDDS